MSGAICQNFPKCPQSSNNGRLPSCERDDCPGKPTFRQMRSYDINAAGLLREQIYTAIRANTAATVAEAEDATRSIIRLVANALPSTPNYGTWHPGDEISLNDPE